VLDLRGRTTLAEAGAIIASARAFVGIDSGPMWIAASLQVPTVGLYGTGYVPAYQAISPANPRAVYLQAEGSPGSISAARVADALAMLADKDGAAR
jgi:ADP-heptose:LPS heptosyltransferase